jgi:hypothetical protein
MDILICIKRCKTKSLNCQTCLLLATTQSRTGVDDIFASGPIVVLQQSFARTFQVIELAAVGGAKEDPDREEYDQNAKRD